MRLRFTIRDLLWLMVGLAGIAMALAACVREYNSVLPPAFVWQFLGGLIFAVVGLSVLN